METEELVNAPERCPACSGELRVTQLRCERCDTEVNGRFARERLVNLPDPYASVLEMFLRLRGNVKEMERSLGLSYPTIRSRLEEAFDAAGFGRSGSERQSAKERRTEIIGQLSRGEVSAAEAAEQIRRLKERR